MTGDPMQRLHDADPVPGTGNAPAFETVLARVRRPEAGARSPRPDRRPRRLRSLRSTLGVAATVAVVTVVAFVALVHPGSRDRHTARASAAPHHVDQVPSPASLLPSHGGMRGLLLGYSLFGSGSTLRVSFTQCTRCATSEGSDAGKANWAATSTDDGQHWQTTRKPALLVRFGLALPSGRDVWASGYAPRSANPTFFASHDSGRTYQPVSAPANSGFQSVTLGGGEAWALGVRCRRDRSCVSSVLHGATIGARLSRTTPPPGMAVRDAPTLLLVTGDGNRAYVSEGAHHRLYASDDDGRTWHLASYPCGADTIIRQLSPAPGGVVWATCAHEAVSPPLSVHVSSNAAASWHDPDPGFHQAGLLVAASGQVAWTTGAFGVLWRTADGGRSWRAVLSGVDEDAAAVDVQSATTATVVAPATAGTAAAHTRRTDLVTYRTTDGGAQWRHTVIRLPTG